MFKHYNDYLHLRNLKEQEDRATRSLQYPCLNFIAKESFMQ
jgi:hypothetical protein